MTKEIGKASRAALALFHFNTQYVAGDVLARRRYCLEAILPALEFASQRKEGTITFEMPGIDLEFLNAEFPQSISLLRDLVRDKRVELISSLFTPSIWVAFPAVDLRKNISLNRKTLKRLKIDAPPVFFAQEGFIGPGIAALNEEFEYFICKDDSLKWLGLHSENPIYFFRDAKVIVARSHLNDYLKMESRGALFPEREREPLHIWYHCGSGHHLVCEQSPLAGLEFRYSPTRESQSEALLQKLAARHYTPTSIYDFARQASNGRIRKLPHLFETSWNPQKSLGVFTWMGYHHSRWENDPYILGNVWRARAKLRACEEAVRMSRRRLRTAAKKELERGWELLLQAQQSDPLGWFPTPAESRSGLDIAEHAYLYSARLLYKMTGSTADCSKHDFEGGGLSERSFAAWAPNVESVGSSVIRWSRISGDCLLLHVCVTSRQGYAGIRVTLPGNAIYYSASGAEDSILKVNRGVLPASGIYLPLANGLIASSGGIAIIRLNAFGQMAAKITRSGPVYFGVQGQSTPATHFWRFAIFNGPPRKACELANKMNRV